MNTDTHHQIANDIWSICNLLRGPYKRNEYRKVFLDCLKHVDRERNVRLSTPEHLRFCSPVFAGARPWLCVQSFSTTPPTPLHDAHQGGYFLGFRHGRKPGHNPATLQTSARSGGFFVPAVWAARACQ
ncbi:type I restriction-modification system subunit M N-terminal domain-containing protein [Candidatus Symbiobacter mobilis]|uniref:N6 DNA methylase n=1 Tax=Candidatus Symbiobacter mobilis CR TaxID=946483 RepID=U5NB32_9BURK|nr:type I restriction-modification system subunit M N-terminal domain-containing protein [Candidatus Symbiobacter mobilis]AGX87369.1 N6 DNA methylase [Candidatus Symbiobacter mobilis CR]